MNTLLSGKATLKTVALCRIWRGSLIALTSATLVRADLRWAGLFGADLHEANLLEADLSNASLENADLRRANLSNANLEKAKLAGVNLRGTIGNCKEILTVQSECLHVVVCVPTGIAAINDEQKPISEWMGLPDDELFPDKSEAQWIRSLLEKHRQQGFNS